VGLRLNLIINHNLILILIASNWFWRRGALERFPGCLYEVAAVERRFKIPDSFCVHACSLSRVIPGFHSKWLEFTSLLQHLARQHPRPHLPVSPRQHPWPFRRYAAWRRSRCKWGRWPWRWLDWASSLRCLRCMMWFGCPKTQSALDARLNFLRVWGFCLPRQL